MDKLPRISTPQRAPQPSEHDLVPWKTAFVVKDTQIATILPGWPRWNARSSAYVLPGTGLDTGVAHLDQRCTAGAHVTTVTGWAVTFLLDDHPAVASLMRATEHRTFAVLRHSCLLAAIAVTSSAAADDHTLLMPKSRPKNRFIAVTHACIAMLNPFTGTASRWAAASPRAERPMSSARHLAKLLINTLVTS